MKKSQLQHFIAALIVFTQPLLGQNVKLAKIALGMSETELKTALASNEPFYVDRSYGDPDMHYLVAETAMESYAFTLIGGKVAAFSVVHILPPGQLPFLPQGQQPTVSILRSLISKQTWTPAKIEKGDTWWFSDASGAPLFNATRCEPESGESWLPFGSVPASKTDERPPLSTEGLMKPSSTAYPSTCGVSIHLNQTPAESEDSVVTLVRYQVLDIKTMNAFLTNHRQR